MKTIEEILPPTYYADMPTAWRVETLVKAWCRAMEVNAQLEARVAELEADLIRERVRIYEATRQHWHGEMGPAWIYVNDLHATLNP